jgi:predicted amidophosphoribosyltransferase
MGADRGRFVRPMAILSAVSSTDEPPVVLDAPRPGCFLCGRPTSDPSRRERAWVQASVAGHQVLVCPRCQEERPDWAVQLDRCESCGATRLSVVLGEVVCRECGFVRGTSVEPAWSSGA